MNVGDKGRLWVRIGYGKNMSRLNKWKGIFMEVDMTRDVNMIRRQVKKTIT
jgi:hypothetical protein